MSGPTRVSHALHQRSGPERDGIWKRYRQAVLDRIGDFALVYIDLSRRRPSSNEWVSALCPFHEDHNPSFSFNRATGHWRCFAGCGEGDALDYLMRITRRSFKEVPLELGDQLVVPRPQSERSPPPPIREQLVSRWAASLQGNKSSGTQAWIAECHRLVDHCVAASGKGRHAAAREAFELIFSLLRHINEEDQKVLFFADEPGVWQVGVNWEEVMPPWFECLAQTAGPDDFAQAALVMITAFFRGDRERYLRMARRSADPAQKKALKDAEGAAPARRRPLSRRR